MPNTVIGLFTDSKKAGEAVSEFKERGLLQDITVIAKDEKGGEVTTHNVESNLADGAGVGAATGAVIGGLTAILAGVASFAIPGAGVVILGPLASLLTGIGTGAVTGGILGALIDWGIPEEQAHMYEERLKAGDVMVGVSTAQLSEAEILVIMKRFGAQQTDTVSY